MEGTALTTILLKFIDSFTKARALIANTLAPLARKLHADVSSCCCYSFFFLHETKDVCNSQCY